MQPIHLKNLEGKWYVQYTNFPMWLKGDKQQPTFNYSILQKNKMIGLYDEVRYIQNGKEKSIVGFDTPLSTDNTKFSWRGKGLLYLFVSKWQILYVNDINTWAIIGFEKTLATPKGYDVITRSENINSAEHIEIQKKMEELNIVGLTCLMKILK
jgi:lipocalin